MMRTSLWVLFLLLAAATSVSAQSADADFRKCDEAYGNAKYADAVKSCTKAVNTKGDHFEARLTRAAANEKLGNDTAAIDDYTQLIGLTNGMAMIHFYRAGIYAKRSKSKEAISDYSIVIEKEPKGRYAARAYYQRGLIYDEMARTNEAQADFWSAARLDPNIPGLKGKIKYPFGDKTLTEAAQMDHIDLSGIQASEKKNKSEPIVDIGNKTMTEAIQDVASDISTAPKVSPTPKPTPAVTPQPANNEQWLTPLKAAGEKMKKGDTAGAIASYTECLNVRKAFACYYGRATAYSSVKKYDLAMKDADDGLKLSSDASEMYALRATLRQVKGDLLGALTDLDSAIKYQPDEPQYYLDRAAIHCRVTYKGVSFKMLAKQDEAKAKELGGTVIKPCK